MDYSTQYIQILRQAASGKLPERVAGDGVIALDLFRELHQDGFIKAIDTSAMDGHEYLNPTISVSGREYLRLLEERQYEKSAKALLAKLGNRALDWISGIVAGLLLAWFSSK